MIPTFVINSVDYTASVAQESVKGKATLGEQVDTL